jgi:hypothetical protein
MPIREIIDGLESAPRHGASVDDPEGSRFVVISETAMNRIICELRLAERTDAEYLTERNESFR